MWRPDGPAGTRDYKTTGQRELLIREILRFFPFFACLYYFLNLFQVNARRPSQYRSYTKYLYILHTTSKSSFKIIDRGKAVFVLVYKQYINTPIYYYNTSEHTHTYDKTDAYNILSKFRKQQGRREFEHFKLTDFSVLKMSITVRKFIKQTQRACDKKKNIYIYIYIPWFTRQF